VSRWGSSVETNIPQMGSRAISPWWGLAEGRPAARGLNADSGNAEDGTKTPHQGPEEEHRSDEFENIEKKTSHKGSGAPPCGGEARESRRAHEKAVAPASRPPGVDSKLGAATRGQDRISTLLTRQGSAARARRVQPFFQTRQGRLIRIQFVQAVPRSLRRGKIVRALQVNDNGVEQGRFVFGVHLE